jgi:hypothetical protein
VRRDTGSPNETLVANLANELFREAIPPKLDKDGKPIIAEDGKPVAVVIDEETVRRCRRAHDKTMKLRLKQ